MTRVILLAVVLIGLPPALLATPYVPPGEALPGQGSEDNTGPVVAAPPRYSPLSYDPVDRFEMCADFITTLQVADTSLATYGGMREGEHMLEVIQTDNTSESIWIWTHYYRLTGQDVYRDNVDAAWEYCMNFPAYDEEGATDPLTGYYRVYNCTWALRAEMEFSEVYGDNTYAAYADSCASYLCHNPLRLYYPAGTYRRLNGLIMSWAVGNLHDYGLHSGNAVFCQKAVATADSVKTWAENNPNKFHWMEWAMEGGVVMWGIVNSWFREYPAGVDAWVDTYAPYLYTEIDSSTYQNAWRNWAALGLSVAGEVLDSPAYAGYFTHLCDTLVANDGDLDGGIPVIDAEPDNRDQSWVTNYLGYMCMDRLISTSGVLASREPSESKVCVSAAIGLRGFGAVSLALSEARTVRLHIYDVAGRSVASRDFGVLGAGSHSLVAGESGARKIAPGVYFYSVDTGREVATGKTVVLE